MSFTDALKAFETLGVPLTLAIKAALIIAKDDPFEPNLGRTEQDKYDINQAWQSIQQQENNE